jgi:amino acid transporter
MSTTGDRSGATVLPDTGRVDREEDARRLAELGYEPRFNREMSLAANFALGFTYLSPVVGVYALFAFALAEAGPPMVWSFFIVGAGQFLVALVFAEVVSQYPIAGGVYPWARRLWGRRYAWLTGWVYAWALLITVASVAYGAGAFAATLLEVEGGVDFTIGTALVIIALASAVNFSGTRNLSRAATAGFIAEIVGALVVGLYLIFFARENGPGVFFDSFGTAGEGTYLGAFLAAALIGLYQFYGFEACGDMAEEVPDPGRRIPKAMMLTILVGGAVAVMVVVGYVLAVPSIDAVAAGENPDPIGAVLTDVFGSVGSKIVLVVVLISFFSCTLSLQAAASRMIYAYGRDRMIFGSNALGAFSERRHVPPGALTVAVIVPALIVLGSRISEDALTKIISFAALGIYIAFQMVVLAALVARVRGWRPSGRFTLGRWGLLVNVLALVYGVAAMVNLAWPRTPDAAWYDNYIVLLSAAIVLGAGLLYMVVARPYRHGTAAHGDAVGGRLTAESAPLEQKPRER